MEDNKTSADTIEYASPVERDTQEGESPKVHFNVWAALGVNFSITATPLTAGTYLALAVGVGGSPIFFYEYIFAAFFQIVLCLGMAEIASAIPHSSGPAHWVKVLGPPQMGHLLGYIAGWSTNACWFFITAVSFLFDAQIIMALVQVCIPSYTPATWHTYLVYCGLTIQGALINLPKAHHVVNWSLKAMVLFINASALFIIISLLVRAHPKASARTVFVDAVNETGWDSTAVVFFISILPGVACVGALDSAPHLTDEVEDPGRTIPLVMIGSAALSALVGIPSIICYLFCIVDPEALLAPVGGQPLVQLMHDAYNSRALTITATLCVVIVFTVAAWAALLSWSRLYWSFSRGGGLPFSNWTAKLSSTDGIPVNAVIMNTVLVLLIGLLELGATTVLNAILGAAGLCGTISFCLPFITLLWRGRQALDPSRWLNLGKLGYIVDLVALIWSLWVCVWISFPLYIPVTASSMNYASVVFMAVVLISVAYYSLSYRHRRQC